MPGGQFKWPLIFDDRHQIIPSFGSAEYSYVDHLVVHIANWQILFTGMHFFVVNSGFWSLGATSR
jgi:hypothetical protein